MAKKICRGFKGLEPDIVHMLPSGDKIGIFPLDNDSCIYLEDGRTGERILNFNDCEFGDEFAEKISKLLPSKIDVVAGQFGLAGWYGEPSDCTVFEEARKDKLNRLRYTSEIFNAKITIPYASFATFSKAGNAYLNKHQTTPQEIYGFMSPMPGVVWLPLPSETLSLANITQINFIKNSQSERCKFWSDLQLKKSRINDYDQNASINDIKSSLYQLAKRLVPKKSEVIIRRDWLINIIVKSQNEDIPCIFDFSKMLLEIQSDNRKFSAHFSIPLDEISYALNYRWGAETLNITGSAVVHSADHYRFFCYTLDSMLKLVY